MRISLLILLLLGGFLSQAQNITKVLDKCKAEKLAKYLDKGGDINIKLTRYDEFNKEFEVDLLTYAVHNECQNCIELLLERREEFIDFDLKVTQAFIYSLSIGNDNISGLLYNQNPIPHGICDVCHGNNALMVAAIYGREDWYFKLKEQSDLQYINLSGSNLIHSAASSPSSKILEDVLKIEGLDINRKEEGGLTPLDYAASNSENKDAFQTLIDKGADHKQAWNLLYWWSMYPGVPLTDEMIEDRRADVWMIDVEGDNCLMLLSHFFQDLEDESGSFAKQFTIVLDIMIADHESGQSNLSFVRQLYQKGITMKMLDAMLYIEDFTTEEPIYPQYLKMIGILCAEAEFCPVYKKEYKTACKIYGDDLVTGWYEQYDIPVE